MCAGRPPSSKSDMASVNLKQPSPELAHAQGDQHSLSPEAQLLLMSAAARPDYKNIRQAVTEGLDWQKLSALAAHEKAHSVLLPILDLGGNKSVESGYTQLRQLAMFTVARMLQLEQVLHDTLDVVAEENIDALLLKGAGLAYTVYPSFGERPMSDIDLLVRPADSQRLWSLLQSRGWKHESARGAERFSGHQHLPPLFEPVANCRVELHHEVLPEEHPFRFSSDVFWRRARRVNIGSRAVKVPHRIHQLWHACVHFAWSHGMQWGSWSTLRDAAAITADPEFEWPAFVAFAAETKAGTCCYWTLRLARDLANAAVPEAVLRDLQPAYPEWVRARLERHFASNLFQSEQRCPSVWLGRRLWSAGITPWRSGHGRKRPWQASDRWTSKSPKSPTPAARSNALRRIAVQTRAAAAYLIRLARIALPTTVQQLRAST